MRAITLAVVLVTMGLTGVWAQGAALGWQALPNTPLLSVCASPSQYPQIQGAEGCSAVINDWNSGVLDSARNRLLLWGGGHNGYYGNELYALDVGTNQMLRLNAPGLPPGSFSPCMETIANGTQPNSRHTYDGMTFIDHADKLFIVSGGLACGTSDLSDDTWTFDFATMRWQNMQPAGDPLVPPGWSARQLEGAAATYDPVSRLVLVDNLFGLLSYDLTSNRYKWLSVDTGGYYGRAQLVTMIMDPDRRFAYVIGDGQVWRWNLQDLNNVPAPALISTSGGSAVVSASAPGLAWDSNARQIVGWAGGNTAYRFNGAANTWSPVTFSGGPGQANPQGTYKRFAYSAQSGVFVSVNHTNQNAYTLRLTTIGADLTPPAKPTGFTLR